MECNLAKRMQRRVEARLRTQGRAKRRVLWLQNVWKLRREVRKVPETLKVIPRRFEIREE